MDPFTIGMLGSAAIGGLASWFGSSSSNKANRDIGRDNNVFSAQQAQLNRDFQERMSNSSWQRGVGDMRAAGINPMLAVSQGGASSPSGTSAQGLAQANQQNELAAIPDAINTALQYTRMKYDIDKLKSDTDLNRQLARTSQEQAMKTKAETRVVSANTSKAQFYGNAYDLANRIAANPLNTAKSVISGSSRFKSNFEKFGERFHRAAARSKARSQSRWKQ